MCVFEFEVLDGWFMLGDTRPGSVPQSAAWR